MEASPNDDRPYARRRFIAFFLMGGGVTVIAAAVLIFFLLGGLFGGNDYQGPGDLVDGFGDIDRQLSDFEQPTEIQPTPTTPPSDAPIASLAIPRFDVEGSVITLGLDENRVMEAPDGPWDIAWYDFTAHPGTGSNAVFSAHVDWYNIGPGGGPGGAIFWNLQDLQQGDLIEVQLNDGTLYQYSVITKRQVDPANDFSPIVGPTEAEMITLITCGGSFDASVGHYTMRIVVQAELMTDHNIAQSAPGASLAP